MQRNPFTKLHAMRILPKHNISVAFLTFIVETFSGHLDGLL